MTEEVRASIMVLANKTADGKVMFQFFVEQNGIWHDTSASGGLSMSLEEAQADTDERLSELMRLVGESRKNNQPIPDHFTAFLQGKFKTMYEGIVPTEVQAYLKLTVDRAAKDKKEAVLRIHMQEGAEWIPWELMFDGVDFLGLRFQISRLPITPGGPDLTEFKRHQLKVYSLLGKNVVSRASDAELLKAWRATFPDLPEVAEQVWHPATDAPADEDWPSVNQMKQAGVADIIHLTCHGGLKDKRGNVYWSLNPDSMWPQGVQIYPDTVRLLELRQRRPLVFGNACASVAGGDLNGGGAGNAGLTPGLGTAFFAQGALNFVGTFAPVTKQIAIEFAREFYKRLLHEQLPVGKALLETKRYYQGKNENDPSWYFYCLYGPQDTRFVAAQD